MKWMGRIMTNSEFGIIIITALVSIFLTSLLVGTVVDNKWQVDAVTHGQGEWDKTTGQFRWKSEIDFGEEK